MSYYSTSSKGHCNSLDPTLNCCRRTIGPSRLPCELNLSLPYRNAWKTDIIILYRVSKAIIQVANQKLKISS